MKKTNILLLSLILVGCAPQTVPSQAPAQVQTFRANPNPSAPLTAKSGFPLALKEVSRILPKPLLFEIDVFKDAEQDTITYGFMEKMPNGVMSYAKVTFERLTKKAKTESISKGGRIPAPVDINHWEVDHQAIFSKAQANGLRDQTFLATLWENTWHISGLKQDLYFQMDSNDSKIKLRCIGPYLNHCTDGDLNPVAFNQSQPNHRTQNIL